MDDHPSALGRILRRFWRDGQVWIVVACMLFLIVIFARHAFWGGT